MKFSTTATVASLFASQAAAHGYVSGIYADGKYYGGFLLDYYYQQKNGLTPPKVVGWYAENLDIGFVSPSAYQTSDINCHKAAAPGKAHATVKAGGSVQFLWSPWPVGHDGPVITYMAKCPGACETADKNSLRWVKVDEAGLNTATQTWAAQDLINRNNTWTIKVPSKISSGSYVFRHEIIALHGGNSPNGAQNYPQCVNIDVTGGGADNPAGTAGTALYKSNDPGILINIYQKLASYKIPGPAVYKS